MADEYIRPYDVAGSSLAEMSLAEQLADVLDVVERETQRVLELISAFCEGKIELVRKGYDYVRVLKEEAQRRKELAMEQLVRASPGLINKEVILLALYHTDALARQIDELAFRVTLLASGPQEKAFCEGYLQMTARLRSMVGSLRNAAKLLNVNVSKAFEMAESVIREESSIDDMYRDLETRFLALNAGSDPLRLVLSRELVWLTENAADTARDVAYGIRYIALHRR